MAIVGQIIYQPYLAGTRGALKPGTAIPCRTLQEGMGRAEKALAAGAIVGAHVVRVLHDPEADEFGDPEYLGEVGRVPEAM